MRPGKRRNVTSWLEQVAKDVQRVRAEVQGAELPDLRSVGVGTMVDGTERITVGGTYVFEVPRDLRHVEAIIRSLLWGYYEALRGDPDDAKVRRRIRLMVDDIVDELGRGCSTRPRCDKCQGATFYCPECGGRCKDMHKMVRCPDCSAWLAPREDAG